MISDFKHDEHKNILKGLQSSDSLKVIETLEELRTTGKVSDIPLLLEMLHVSRNPDVKAKITDLFANLKESDAIPLIMEAIKSQRFAPELKDLLATCWENGLDYSEYLSLFIELMIETEFQVALEAYTVIMNMTSRIEQQKIDREMERLEIALKGEQEQKRQLYLDVIDFLPSIGF
jgi:hypothetical protein